MSLSCDNLVRDLGNVSASARVVAAVFVFGLTEGELGALADGQRVRVVEHVGLRKSRFVAVDVLDRHVGLGQPLSLNIDAFLRVVLIVQVLAHQVRDLAHLLLVEGAGSRACEPHLGGVLKQAGRARGAAEIVAVLRLEETLLIQTGVGGQQRAEPFTGSVDVPVVQVGVLVHVLCVNDADHGLGLNHVHLGVLVLLLVGGLADAEAVVAHELLGNLLRLAVVGAEGRRNTSRIQSTNRVVMLSQSAELGEHLVNLGLNQPLLIPILVESLVSKSELFHL